MLQLINISKSYTTASFTQKALDDVSISFRENEFVAVLGPSGSGKTTLLNIVGGLDQYDSGDLVIDGVSTKEYKDRDWDIYRNNRIGFVFQSYNLIPHQTVLANVELALTLSGVGKSERRERAIDALERVGLGDHIHKKPNQLSGGQMQRVAVARALINDPEILLADEPTGALDTSTSAQIMDLLKEIAKERLIIMVTHNPELAEEYANRTINLRDGQVTHDSNPFHPTALTDGAEDKPIRRTSMSFLTAISLSFNNLMTKKGRTIMTAVAGSIGIIGIAAILALANGVNGYIKNIEEETLSLYPLTIESTGFDIGSMFMAMGGEFSMASERDDGESEGSDRLIPETKIVVNMISGIQNNDLASLKKYLDSENDSIDEYVNIISYGYDIKPLIFSNEASGTQRQINPNTSLSGLVGGGMLGGSMGEFAAGITSGSATNAFQEMLDSIEMLDTQYDIVEGRWATEYDECVLVLGPTGGVSDFVLYAMGLRDQSEFDDMVKAIINDEELVVDEERLEFTPEELMGVTFKIVNRADTYAKDKEHNVWLSKVDDTQFMKPLIEKGTTLHIVGIVKESKEGNAHALMPGLAYSPRLQEYLIKEAAKTEIVKEQLANPGLNVISGRTFQDEIDNPENSSLDFSSLFDFDENALNDAFKFDMPNLDLNMSGMDRTSLDMSALANLDIDLSGLDLSGIELDPSLMPEMPQIDFESILSEISIQPNPAAMEQVMSNLMAGYMASSLFDPTDIPGSFLAYMELPEAQAILMGGLADVVDQGALEKQIQEALQKQMADAMNAYIGAMMTQYMAAIEDQITTQLTQVMTTVMTQMMEQAMNQIMGQISGQLNSSLAGLSNAFNFDTNLFEDAFEFDIDPTQLRELMMSALSLENNTFESNLRKFDYADFDKPTSINIYPKDFDSKAEVITILDNYNARMEEQGYEDKVISYTDFVGTLMKSVTTIINMISYVLVAFVSISLFVSSIMIGIITYISVLERKKEIGILRSIGASKGDIGRVFNAETLIVGLSAGLIGVGITGLATIPINYFIGERMLNVSNITILPWQAAGVLVLISMGLSLIAGIIPSSAASRKDPVEALRSE